MRDEGEFQNHRLQQSSGMFVHSGQTLGGETSYGGSKSMSNAEFANSSNLLQRQSSDMPPEKSLQKMLQASHLRAMEIMLKGVNTSESVYTPDRIGKYDHSCLCRLIYILK